MAVEILLLGPPRVLCGGEPVAFDTRKAIALLAHLALTDRPRPRETLCELLYPGHAPDRSRGALRRTLSTLRKGVGEEWIDTAGDSISLRRGAGLCIDVERFRQLVSDDAPTDDLTAAVGLFSGDFLEGFSLRDSPEFDDWQMSVAGTLRTELAATLRRLAERLAAGGDLGRALECARRWLALDPLQETAHRELMRLYAWSGDRAAAFEQYRNCVRTLSQELGVAPLQETATLYAQVSDGTLAPPRPDPSPPAARRAATAGAPAELPLVDRAEHLAALLAAHAAAHPDGAFAVIEGEAGIGKSRLAAELTGRAAADGAVVLAARCYDDESGVPYGPVTELLREAARSARAPGWTRDLAPQRLADAALLLPELGELSTDAAQPVPLEGPGAQVRLLEAVAAVPARHARVRTPGSCSSTTRTRRTPRRSTPSPTSAAGSMIAPCCSW